MEILIVFASICASLLFLFVSSVIMITICFIVSWVWCIILPDKLTGKFFLYLEKKDVPVWILDPLGACEVCFSGQFSLWTSIFVSVLTLVVSIELLSLDLFPILCLVPCLCFWILFNVCGTMYLMENYG